MVLKCFSEVLSHSFNVDFKAVSEYLVFVIFWNVKDHFAKARNFTSGSTEFPNKGKEFTKKKI